MYLTSCPGGGGALFIVDDIQMRCGRKGELFSFEFAALSRDRLRGVRRMAARRAHWHVPRQQPRAGVCNRGHNLYWRSETSAGSSANGRACEAPTEASMEAVLPFGATHGGWL